MANTIIDTNKDTSTYDVQQRTFIRKPEPKVCPSCGQLMPTTVHPMKTDMSYYISGVEGANPVVIGSLENILEIQGTPMYRVTGRDINNKMISEFIPLAGPVTPTQVIPTIPLASAKVQELQSKLQQSK